MRSHLTTTLRLLRGPSWASFRAGVLAALQLLPTLALAAFLTFRVYRYVLWVFLFYFGAYWIRLLALLLCDLDGPTSLRFAPFLQYLPFDAYSPDRFPGAPAEETRAASNRAAWVNAPFYLFYFPAFFFIALPKLCAYLAFLGLVTLWFAPQTPQHPDPGYRPYYRLLFVLGFPFAFLLCRAFSLTFAASLLLFPVFDRLWARLYRCLCQRSRVETPAWNRPLLFLDGLAAGVPRVYRQLIWAAGLQPHQRMHARPAQTRELFVLTVGRRRRLFLL